MEVRESARVPLGAFCAGLTLLCAAASAEPAEVVRVRSEQANVYARPALDFSLRRGQVEGSSEFVLLRRYEGRRGKGLFFEILWRGERVWIASETVDVLERRTKELSEEQLAELAHRSPEPERWLKKELHSKLEHYNSTVRAYETRWAIEKLPSISLLPKDPEDVAGIVYEPLKGVLRAQFGLVRAPPATADCLLVLGRADKLLLQFLAKEVFKRFRNVDTAEFELRSDDRSPRVVSFDRIAWERGGQQRSLDEFWTAVVSLEGPPLFCP